ncbi:sugar-binding transcriptional regulator [Arthrobacter sp. GMC3]|uniref:sugar-binding transcriptional regulator n=1 Tax=Arthrobacter sp. GMC3 TaxID=2058894 RepID=UPI0015E48465|nr:sugar-binding domain-containing protein [Arthrobacter sp. GMC3]
MGRVARMYYEHGLTHQEIANLLGVSRVRVTRLLAEARESGMVEIIVHVAESLFADEEQALVERYGIKQAWVAPSVAEASKADRAFAVLGAESLSQIIEKGSVVALGLSTAVALVVSSFPMRPLEASFVPLAGSTGGLAKGANPHQLALELAARTQGSAFHLPAPLLAASTEAALSAYADPGVKEVLVMAEGADVLVAGLGGMEAGQGILLGNLTADQREDLLRRGAVGDMGGRFFDAAGNAVTGPLDDRVVGVTLEALKSIPNRLVVARGATKVTPLKAALAGGLVNMLVTDVDTARALLL